MGHPSQTFYAMIPEQWYCSDRTLIMPRHKIWDLHTLKHPLDNGNQILAGQAVLTFGDRGIQYDCPLCMDQVKTCLETARMKTVVGCCSTGKGPLALHSIQSIESRVKYDRGEGTSLMATHIPNW